MSGEQLTALYRRYGPLMFARCARVLADAAAAEDAAQEMFVRVRRKIARASDDQEIVRRIDIFAARRHPAKARNSERPHAEQTTLDLLLLGTEWPERATAEAHLQSCSACTDRFTMMREHADDFLANRFIRSNGVVIQRLDRRPWLVLGPAILAAIGVMVLSVRHPYLNTQMHFTLGRDGAMRKVSGTAKAQTGDALAVVTEGASGKELLIIGMRDGEPAHVYTSTHVAHDGPVAIAVDGAAERIFAIISRTPVSPNELQLPKAPDGAKVIELNLEAF